MILIATLLTEARSRIATTEFFDYIQYIEDELVYVQFPHPLDICIGPS